MWREWKRKEQLKRVSEGHPGGRRKTGRPRKQWLDDIEVDLRLMKVKTWRKTREGSWGKNRMRDQGLHGL
jgi:hypothetical protein